MNKYEDIINMEHYEPKKHMRMGMTNRAAQFAPFAALTGYEDAVRETGRITEKRIILSEDEIEVVNAKIKMIKENINNQVKVKITYFVADCYKDGGNYEIIEGVVKRIDEGRQVIILKDKKEIKMSDIIEIIVEIEWDK